MKRFIFTLLVSIAAVCSLSAADWKKDLWYDGGNSATITWDDTKFFDAATFSDVNVGDYIQIDIISSTGAIELKSNGFILPGTVKCDKPNAGGAYTYKAYITADMLASLKAHGLLVCGASFVTNGIKIFNDGTSIPEGAIWAGYTWVDGWKTLELAKETFNNYAGQRFIDVYLSSDNGNNTDYTFEILTEWSSPWAKTGDSNQTAIHRANRHVIIDLQHCGVTSVDEMKAKLNQSYLIFNVYKGNDKASFNITAVALRDNVNAFLCGDFSNSWALIDNYKFAYDKDSETYTINVNGTLEANDTFKVYLDDNTWFGYNNISFVDPHQALVDNGGNDHNIKINKELVNPTFTFKKVNDKWLLTVKDNRTYTYGIHGSIFGNDSWETLNMTKQADGTFALTMALRAGAFGVKAFGESEVWFADPSNQTVADGQALTLATSNINNFSSSLTGLYTITLDPVAMTITFTPVANIPATIQAVPNAAANYNAFQINVADYFVTRSGEYSLTNGTYSATSTDGIFANVPYSESAYTISYSVLSAEVAIAQPAFTAADFNVREVNSELIESVTPGKANLFVKVKATSGYYYALPQVVCKVDDVSCDNVTVAWNSSADKDAYDFAITVPDAIDITKDEYGNLKVTGEKTFNVSITPQYPFAVVAPASAEAPRRAAGVPTALFAGMEVAFDPITVTPSTEVSGVEGIETDSSDAPAEYYNFQGQRVNGELTPGCYIRRQGSSVTKVMIRF